jgi:drug/metabolite transporter superfamily protein YnfA
MRRLEPIVVAFFGIALLWGFATAMLADAAGWDPIVAPASTAVPIALFGWLRRGRELLDVAAPAFAVSYAAYIGLAVVRLAQFDEAQAHVRVDLLDHRWPPVLLAGVAFALIFTVCIAVPASALTRRRHVENERDTRFWTIVREQNAARKER